MNKENMTDTERHLRLIYAESRGWRDSDEHWTKTLPEIVFALGESGYAQSEVIELLNKLEQERESNETKAH